jgi:hypothetical protein
MSEAKLRSLLQSGGLNWGCIAGDGDVPIWPLSRLTGGFGKYIVAFSIWYLVFGTWKKQYM